MHLPQLPARHGIRHLSSPVTRAVAAVRLTTAARGHVTPRQDVTPLRLLGSTAGVRMMSERPDVLVVSGVLDNDE